MPTQKFQCRWALIGLSNIATTFVDDLLLPRDEPDQIQHSVVCVSTTGSVERAKGWLEQRQNLDAPSVSIFTSADEMLKSGGFDVVYISTPHPQHYKHALAAIQNGHNTLVEKPITMNGAQFKKLAEEAKSNKVVLMEAMWTRYLPAVLHLQQELLPRIGSVKRVFSDLSVPIASKDMPITSRLLDKKAGAGALLDMGVYALSWVDIAFSGSTAAKVAYATTISYDTGKDAIDDINTILISGAEDGGIGIVTTSLSLAGSVKAQDKLAVKKVSPSVRIEATNAQICIPFPLIRPQELQIEWYNDENLDGAGREKHETIAKPVERGWGLWYQADFIAKVIQEMRENGSDTGHVIGELESARILEWMDFARGMAGIEYDADDEAV